MDDLKNIGHEAARQGQTGLGVRYVLGWSIALAVAAFVVIYFVMY